MHFGHFFRRLETRNTNHTCMGNNMFMFLNLWETLWLACGKNDNVSKGGQANRQIFELALNSDVSDIFFLVCPDIGCIVPELLSCLSHVIFLPSFFQFQQSQDLVCEPIQTPNLYKHDRNTTGNFWQLI